jgi:hypothetical protein
VPRFNISRGVGLAFRRVFRLRPAQPGIPGSVQGWGRIFSGHTIQTALGSTQPYILRLPGARGKLPSTEASHSPTFSAEVKNAWTNNSISSYVFLAWSLGTGVRIRIEWKYSEKNSVSLYVFIALLYRII